MSTDQKYDTNQQSAGFLDLTAKQPVNQTQCEPVGSARSFAETWRLNLLKREQEVAVLQTTQTPVIDEDESLNELISRFVSELPSSENLSILLELERAYTDCQTYTEKSLKRSAARVSEGHYEFIQWNALRIATFLAALHAKWNAATKYELELAEPICNDAEEGLSHE